MNKVVIKQMIRISSIIKELKEARAKLASASSNLSYFVTEGNTCDEIKHRVTDNVSSCLYLEQCLRSSVSKACKHLDGFNPSIMDPIDYISSSDVKNKFIDICRGNRVVATIDITTGNIEQLNNQNVENIGEDKSSAVKSQQ